MRPDHASSLGRTILPDVRHAAEPARRGLPWLRPTTLAASTLLLAGGVGVAGMPAMTPAASTGPSLVMVSSRDQGTPSTVLTSKALTTSGPEFLVAFLNSDSGGSGASFSSLKGCSLAWTRAVSSNAQPGV